jgi:uncharacterized repeat protein (TIGR02543 family)
LYTEGGGHALLPYAVEYPTPTTPKILLYDSNWPGKNRFVDVDLKAKTWRFSFSGEDPANDPDAWTGGPQDMDLTPLSARTGTCPFCGDGTKVAKTTMLIRSSNLDWSVETNGGVVSPESPVGTDGTSVLPVKGSVKRDSYDYLVSVPNATDTKTDTTIANKKNSSKLKFSASTSVYAIMPDGIAQFTTSGKSDNPVEIEGSSISTKDPAVDLTLASGNLVANASGAAISLSVSGGEMAVSVTTASGQVVQQQVSEDKPTLQMKADPTGGGITVLAASSTGVVEKTAVSATGVETKTIVKEVLNLSAVKAELPPELASKEIAALPSLANRNMANPNYKVDPVYVAPTTTAPKENSGNVSSKGAPQEPTVGRLIIPSVEFGDAPFTVPAPTSNSKGEWKFSSNKPDVAQVATTGRVTIMGAGSATITATQAATKDYESISVTADLTVARATPVLGAFSTTTRTVGEEAFTLANPTSTSSAVFKLESSDESVAKFSRVNGKLSIVGAGRTTITASQPANDDYLAASKNFVLTVRKGTPVLTATADLSATFGQDGPTIAKPTSESRGAISFASSNLPVATVNATTGKLTIVSAGTTTITVTQAATDDYVSATQTLTFTVGKAQPTLGALSVGSKTFGDASFSITKPTSVSSGAFTFTSSNSSVVMISESGTASIEGAGTATITATQAATGNYTANSVTTEITVAKKAPELSNISLTGLVYGDADFTMQPRSTSTGAFTFTSNNAPVLAVNETTGRVRVVRAGTATITVRQASTTNYEAASSSVTVQVGLATPAFQRLDPITKQGGDATFLFNWGTSPSDGAITYSSNNLNAATIDPTTGRVTIVGAGVATLTMTQSQGTNHTAASIVVVLTVERGTPVYGDFVIPTKTYGAADFLLTRPTTTSSGAFTFSTRLNGTLNDTSVATVDSDGFITIVAPGSVEIIATQAQTNTHTASSISTTFVVTKATPTLSGFGGESAGLSGTRYVNYYADDPNWFATATLHGDTVTSTQIQGFSSNDERYSWQWLGTFRSAAAGTYNFCTSSDDASHLWIGASATSGFTTSNATVNNGGLHPVQNQCGNVTLAAATNYPIRIQFGEYTGDDAISVYFTPPGGTTTYDGTGYFFSGGGLTKTLGDQPFTPTIPTSESTGAITYSSSDTSVATIHPTSGLITVLSGGTTTITATQAATSNYNSATVTTTLTVLLDPMIGAMSPITKTYGVEPFTLTAPATNSPGAITYTSSDTSVATVNATTGLVTLTGVGSTTITATQAATASYTSASTSTTLSVVVGFTVSGLNDFFFDLVAGTTFTVRTYAEQYGIDSQLWLYTSSDVLITTNDDYFGLDSYISYSVPSSGRYRLRTGMWNPAGYDPDYWLGTGSYIVETSWLNALTIATDEQGGSAINNAFTTTGGIISSSLGTPTRSGYTFNGWFTASSGGSALSFPYTHNQTANFTLYAQWTCASGGTCVVGDTGPGGGIIFYVHPVGTFACGANLELSCKYLEAAPTTGTNAWVDENYLWSGNTTVAIGASASGVVIGTGYSNTLAIVGQSGGGNTSDRAATVTRAYRGPNGLSDWFLPSRDEVYQLHLNSARVSLGNAFDDFWTSTESDSHQALITWNHGDGSFYGNAKDTPNAVRPIRAFG